jgi:hypothetical protein
MTIFQMQEKELDAKQLVFRLFEAPPQQQEGPALALVSYCRVQPFEDEWQDVAGRIGFPVALVQAMRVLDNEMQIEAFEALACLVLNHEKNLSDVINLTKASDLDLQRYAVWIFGRLVENRYENQCFAGALGAIGLVIQLSKSIDAELQRTAVWVLGRLVEKNEENQCAAGTLGAIGLMLQLSRSSDVELQRNALWALSCIVENHEENQCAAGALGAIADVINLTKSSDVELQRTSVWALGRLVEMHQKNQRAAGALGAKCFLGFWTPC